MSLVLDTTVAIAWLAPDESSDYADRAMAHAIVHGADVPSLLLSEVTNVLLMKVRRRLMTPAMIRAAITDLRRIELRHDGGALGDRLLAVVETAEAHGLTGYDATYLELALRLGLPLASLDENLVKAARAAGAELFAP